MCGIVGYAGHRPAVPLVVEELHRLEYRGYDSAGIAVLEGSEINVAKAMGRLKVLREKTNNGQDVKGVIGIGHTRWATHGEPSEGNAHPHCNADGSIVGVHNGIIENYQELKQKLLKHGYTFYSGTDTEVAIKLVDYYYKKYLGTPVDALNHAMVRIRGSYALAVMFKDYPEEIYVARKDSPMILGVADGESYIASDVPAILKHTRNVYYIGNMELGRVQKGKITFYNLDGDEIEKELVEIKWDAEAAEKAGFEHFMIKEIHEEPKAVQDTLNSVIHDGRIDLAEMGLDDEMIRSVSQIYLVACGSAYHAGMSAQYAIEDLAKIPVRVELASEFRYREMPLDEKGLVVVISQSGETADTLTAIKQAKAKGSHILIITNRPDSAMAREADSLVPVNAGIEVSVAATKSYIAQLVSFYLLAIYLAEIKESANEYLLLSLKTDLMILPQKIEQILSHKEEIQKCARLYSGTKDFIYIARGINYPTALEGALKLKEISYINATGYPAGELKHGPIAMLDETMPVLSILMNGCVYEKLLSNSEEAKARNARMIALTNSEDEKLDDLFDFIIRVPDVQDMLSPIIAIVPLQLLAYYIAEFLGKDVDQPRNLAKSVTVE